MRMVEQLFARIKNRRKLFFLPLNLLFFAGAMKVVSISFECLITLWIPSMAGMTMTTIITG